MRVINKSVVLAMNNQFKSLRNVFDSITGKYHNDPDKKWLIDVDGIKYNEFVGIVDMLDEILTENIITTVLKLQSKTKNEPMVKLIPTKNGTHIITRPFNLQKLKEDFPEIDVHKDAITLLYCPE